MYEELFVTPTTEKEALERLIKVVEVLRSPGGCPWDREQTHESLRRGMIEESYEVIQAIENNDLENLNEELGDVLLQVVMHAQIAKETDEFTIVDIANAESEKMIRRHPHVFAKNIEKSSNSDVVSVDNVLDLWENIKRDEHEVVSVTESMNKVPRHLPALLRSEKVQKKARRAGFDWEDASGAFDKVDEEAAELREAFTEGDREHMKEELGDLLFAVTNIARFLDIDPEDALNSTTNKFIKRFSYVEEGAAKAGRKLENMTLAEMDVLWEEAKTKE
ncbi:MAG: nucleoside triphosphate pyrophosphohydrolase [Clostridia bacterium]|nr:nucleoside triphosphate pyrophosphohydrolase [Clostridia bacterium]